MKRPVIGVVPLWDEEKDSLWMLPGYMQGIEAAGGLPVMLPLTENKDILSRVVSQMEGFLFTGGHDVSPALYGEKPISECGTLCHERDAMEQKLFEEALRTDIPILGICRGIQLFNALLGGTLYQDLPTQVMSPVEHHQSPPYHLSNHEVKIIPETPLHQLLGQKTLQVNSYHHQAIREMAPQLVAMAQAPDGLVEAVYLPGKRFVWAVQWHPEYALGDHASQALFGSLLTACLNV